MRTSTSTRSGGNGGNGQIIIRYDAPEINVTGNGNSIPDNATSTSTANFTDLGTTDVGVAISRTYVIQNTGTLALTIGAFSITGTHATNFTLTTAPQHHQ
jgi:trimeric autotransporter adhesin